MRNASFEDERHGDIAIGIAGLMLFSLRLLTVGLYVVGLGYWILGILASHGIAGNMQWGHAAAVATLCWVPAWIVEKLGNFVSKRIDRARG
ncbi:hypothetical protein [Paraburkholderia fungorum]|uniref:hypothetical protein n=1 Tax=Paraburkholderia fungorum TaxID=134537 RepID=UPI001617ECCC|nr:hypothetical protein [Paraburkholderia fungorum]MBB5547581.1 hypothetical protein [Paraburkholderia fungorum]